MLSNSISRYGDLRYIEQRIVKHEEMCALSGMRTALASVV
jgi:hypothetical protein